MFNIMYYEFNKKNVKWVVEEHNLIKERGENMFNSFCNDDVLLAIIIIILLFGFCGFGLFGYGLGYGCCCMPCCC
ncbi:hypothetical protein [Clostridium tepidiprofundi]|uniref:hypothetical protein n=1 Tax=Clostridium tepidiprofundi TaxID=420412 RepID=UPI00128EF05B|nr:hypothetical protein [Clostridium tepidiprofundi]